MLYTHRMAHMTDTPSVRSLGNHLSLRERIANHLREAIVSGAIPAKTRLMEPELARQLSVSRTPLREAIRQLEAEGFLTTIPRVGTFVSELTAQDLDDIYTIRAVLEGLAARQAAENPDRVKEAPLHAILNELSSRIGNYHLYHEASGRFHEVIFALSGNRRLQLMYQTLSQQVTRLRTLSLAVRQRPEVSLREHRRVTSAILRGRGAEAERLMRAHIEGALVVLRRRLRSRGEGNELRIEGGERPANKRRSG
jgi:DNA-binding GntR family transcriptional regulator